MARALQYRSIFSLHPPSPLHLPPPPLLPLLYLLHSPSPPLSLSSSPLLSPPPPIQYVLLTVLSLIFPDTFDISVVLVNSPTTGHVTITCAFGPLSNAQGCLVTLSSNTSSLVVFAAIPREQGSTHATGMIKDLPPGQYSGKAYSLPHVNVSEAYNFDLVVVWSQGEGVEWCGAKVRGWSGVEPR